VTGKYEFIDAEYAVLPENGAAYAPTIMQMCGWLGVSKSGYYEWRSRPESATARRRELLKIKINALFEANDETYGYRRLHAALVRGGEQASDELVRQLIREIGRCPASRSQGAAPSPPRTPLQGRSRTWSTVTLRRKIPAISPVSSPGKAGFIARQS
jgi:putative transposase